MSTVGEQLQLSRRLGTAMSTHRSAILSSWLRALRDIPREFHGRTPATHLEEFAPPTLDALIVFLSRGDRKSTRRVAISWANRQDSLGLGLGESLRGLLALGPAIAPLLRRLGLERGQPLVEGYLAQLAEELSRAYTAILHQEIHNQAKAISTAEERLLSLQMVAGAVAQERDQHLTLTLIAQEIVKLTGADIVNVFLPGTEPDLLHSVIVVPAQVLDEATLNLPISQTAVGDVYQSGHLLVSDDTETLPNEAVASTILAPLRTRNDVIGVLRAEKHNGAPFNRADVELLGLFADQAAIALENARLFHETHQRTEEIATLYRIGAVANRSLDLDRILGDALESTLDALDLDAGTIYLFDRTSQRLELRTACGINDPTDRQPPPATIAASAGPLGECLRRGEPLLIDDVREFPQLIAGFPLAESGNSAVRFIGIPLRAKDRLLGVLNVLGTTPRDPQERDRDLALVRSIGDQIGVAIDNAQLLRGREERLSQLTTLNDFLRALTAILDVDSLFETLYLGCTRLFDTNTFYIALIDPTTSTFTTRRWYIDGKRVREREGQPIVQGLSPVVIAEGRPILTDDYWAECRQRGVQGSQRFIQGPLSWLGVPMTIGGRILGTIVLASPDSSYTVEDATLLSAVASGCAVAIENARLFEAEYRRQQELTSILDITTAATSSLLLDEVLEVVAHGLSNAVDGLSCGIYLLDDSGSHLIPRASVGYRGGPLSGPAADLTIALDDDPFLAETISSSHAQITIDAAGDPRTNKVLVQLLGLYSLLAVPLIAKGRPLGVAVVAALKERYYFTTAQARLAEAIADTAALAVENARLYARSREFATAEERNRLAREIHDTLAQGLTAVTLQLEVADALLDDPQRLPDAREKIRQGLDLTRANLEEARRSVMDLRAAPLQEQTLPEAFAQLLNTAAREYGFEGCFRVHDIEGRLPSHIEAGFYRIGQELLSNIGKHAKATQVDITLKRLQDSLVLVVTDDGVGFDPAKPPRHGATSGFGLIGLRERVALLGGQLEIASAPDEGTSVRVSVSLPGTEQAVRQSNEAATT